MPDLSNFIPLITQYPGWVKVMCVGLILYIAIFVIVLLTVAPVNTSHQDASALENNTEVKSDYVPPGHHGKIAESDAAHATQDDKQNHDEPLVSTLLPGEILQTLDNKKMTEIQRKIFIEDHKGMLATWTMKVLDVTQHTHFKPYIVCVVPSEENPNISNIIGVEVDKFSLNQLSDIHKGDIVSFQGLITFTRTGFGYTLGLSSAKIVGQ